MLKKLVLSFDDEHGLPEFTYIATAQLIKNTLGVEACYVFSRYVDAANDRFYLKEGTGQKCWEEMLNAAL